MVPLKQEVSATDRLRANLAAQTVATQDMDALLFREREGIGASDWPAVQGVAAEKLTVAARLQNLMRELLFLTADAPGTRLNALGLKNEWAALLDAARRLQGVNRESRVLLDRHRARAGAALQVLNRGDSTPTYGRHGTAGFGGLRQKIASA
ncbi:MAG: flagellar export chaperone FlgN [Panacagrimonas sp.]